MSINVEWMNAGAAGVLLAHEGHVLPDGQKVDPGWFALVVEGGSGTLIAFEGDRAELKLLLSRMAAALSDIPA